MKLTLGIKKVVRYFGIYGVRRTVVKVLGRRRAGARLFYLFFPLAIFGKREVALIGCGQFGFSTISFYVNGFSGKRISKVYDVNTENARSLARFYGASAVENVHDIFDSSTKVVYIASNHSTHTSYALMALQKNLDVYIEKPISVTTAQLQELDSAVKASKGRVFCGYNRPFSGAIQKVKRELSEEEPIMASVFVIGHYIESDHWYRRPEEGTRVCGNLGHWLDLCVHLLNRSNISELKIGITYSSENTPDDNLSVVLTSDKGDMFSVILTSYSEPFEGISETISIHQRNYQVLIDDFRKATFQRYDRREEYSYTPKDVGHRAAILQPFSSLCPREFEEFKRSTRLMLLVKEMVLAKATQGYFTWRVNEASHSEYS